MQDISIIYRDGLFDLDLGDGGAAIDESLRTAVVVSLFTDRLAEADDVLPGGSGDRRGWWGDIYPQVDADRIGSRLWLLAREKQIPTVLGRAETYAREALQWCLDDGLAAAITISASFVGPGVLGLDISLRLADGSDQGYRITLGADGAAIEE
jgi:phage gp46-like protein